jgi:hypothetical protein
MMDEGRLSLEMARAAQAERLLGDTMLQDAINAVKAKYENAAFSPCGRSLTSSST